MAAAKDADPAAYGHKVRPQPKKPRTAEDEQRAEEWRKVIACNRAWKPDQALPGPHTEGRHDQPSAGPVLRPGRRGPPNAP